MTDYIQVSREDAEAAKTLLRMYALDADAQLNPEDTVTAHLVSDRLSAALRAEPVRASLPSPPVLGGAVAWLRDAHNGDGDECLVPCAKGDPGGFPVYASPITNEPVGVILPQDDASFIAEMLLGSIEAIETEDASFTSTDRAAALILRAKLKRLVSALNGEQ